MESNTKKLLAARFLFVGLLSTVVVLSGGGILLRRPVGVAYIVLFILWMLSTVLGRPVGQSSIYNRSQRVILVLGSLAIIPLVILAPWEYTHFSGPIPRDTVLAWFGLALFAAGICLQTAAMATLQGMYTLRLGVQRHRLITTGAYRVVRHPGYLGNILELFGIGLSLSSLFALATAFLVVPLLLLRIRDEEAMLKFEYPEYEDYTRHTKRLVPFIW